MFFTIKFKNNYLKKIKSTCYVIFMANFTLLMPTLKDSTENHNSCIIPSFSDASMLLMNWSYLLSCL